MATSTIKPIYLVVDVPLGVSLNNVFKQADSLAKRKKLPVAFSINGKCYVIDTKGTLHIDEPIKFVINKEESQ